MFKKYNFTQYYALVSDIKNIFLKTYSSYELCSYYLLTSIAVVIKRDWELNKRNAT